MMFLQTSYNGDLQRSVRSRQLSYQLPRIMTYEEFLDEITTLLTELYDLEDEAAIKIVVDAQAADYFVTHDDKEELRTVAQAKLEAAALYQAKQNKNQTQRKQQLRQVQKKKAP